MSKERPILFSGPMVRAILEGRKTQTRRVVKLKEGEWTDGNRIAYDRVDRRGTSWNETKLCPYGVPSDRLWVRESYAFADWYDGHAPCEVPRTDIHDPYGDGSIRQRVWYQADEQQWNPSYRGKWRPSIHMPRWASRITLEVKAVRVERLQQISAADAMAEGCSVVGSVEARNVALPREQFQMLWDSINTRPKLPDNKSGKRHERVKKWLDKHPDCSWNANPWVWVVEFERVPSATNPA